MLADPANYKTEVEKYVEQNKVTINKQVLQKVVKQVTESHVVPSGGSILGLLSWSDSRVVETTKPMVVDELLILCVPKAAIATS